MTEEHKRLNDVALSRSILGLDHLQDFAGSDEAVACVGVRFVGRDSGIGVGVVVDEVLLNQNTEAVPNVP